MSQYRETSMYKHIGTTGAETESALPTNDNVDGNSFQVAEFASLAGSGATYSEEQWLGMKWLEPTAHVKLLDAKVTKIHGTLPTGVTLNAGYTATYATPKAVTVQSTVATAAIPGDIRGANPLAIATYDATDEEYQFLVLQNAFSGAGAYDPYAQVGNSGFPTIEVLYSVADRTMSMNPGGDDLVNAFNGCSVDIYVIDDNGDMQLFGCTENSVEANMSAEWTSIMKGAMNGDQNYAWSKRNKQITGNLTTLNPYTAATFGAGNYLGDDGYGNTVVQFTTGFKSVRKRTILMDMFSTGGSRLTVVLANSVMRATAGDAFGGDTSAKAFEIIGGNAVNYVWANNIVDRHVFKVIQVQT